MTTRLAHDLALEADRVTTGLLALRRELPGARIHVALDSMPHPTAIRAVDAFGASFAVTSRRGIDALEREGVAIGPCLHTDPVRTIADITSAYLRGIRTFVVDRADEITKFQELPDAAVLVRLAFPEPGASLGPSSAFGVTPHDAGALVGRCVRAGLRVAGFTWYVDRRTASAVPLARAMRRTLALMRRLERARGLRFDTIHVGGLPAAVDRPAPELAELARTLRAGLAHAPSRYRLLVEAG